MCKCNNLIGCTCKANDNGNKICKGKKKDNEIDCKRSCLDINCIKYMAEHDNMYEYFQFDNLKITKIDKNYLTYYAANSDNITLSFKNFGVLFGTDISFNYDKNLYYNINCCKCNHLCNDSCSNCTTKTYCINGSSCADGCTELDCKCFLSTNPDDKYYYKNVFKEFNTDVQCDKSYDYRYFTIIDNMTKGFDGFDNYFRLYFFYKEENGELTDHYLYLDIPFSYIYKIYSGLKFKKSTNCGCSILCLCGFYNSHLKYKK
jgi:hypothetical protein